MSQDTNETLVSRFGLFLARFCTSAWIGAAALFVVVGIREIRNPGFDSTVRDMLVTIRFPAFYVCGGTLLGLALTGSLLAHRAGPWTSARQVLTLGLLTSALVLMAVDYVSIYQPLAGMVAPPGQAKAASFTTYHEASKWINLAGLLICLVAAWALNWPHAGDRKPQGQ